MMHSLRSAVILMPALLFMGCTGMQSDFETPSVQVVGIRPVTSADNYPRFEIDLRVLNPNRKAIRLKGASYSLSLDNFEVIKGVAADLPTLPAYGEAQFTVGATLSWLQSFRLILTLANEPRDQVNYELKAKLDTGLPTPSIRITEAGSLSVRSLKSIAVKR